MVHVETFYMDHFFDQLPAVWPNTTRREKALPDLLPPASAKALIRHPKKSGPGKDFDVPPQELRSEDSTRNFSRTTFYFR